MEWQAFYVMEASDQDPEVTKWDDVRSAQEKVTRAALAKERAKQGR